MKSAVRMPLGALLVGLAAYLVLSLAWPEIEVSKFANIIGFAAVLGGLATVLIGRALDRRRRSEPNVSD